MEAGPASPPLPGAAVLPGGGGTVPSASGGVGGRRPRGPRVGWGGWGNRGGGVAPWLRTSPLWGEGPVALCPVPPSSLAHPPQVYAFCRGRGAAPVAGCGLPPAGQPGGGGGGPAACEPPLQRRGGGAGWPGVALPRSVPLPSLGGQQTGRHSRCSGHGGRGPHTAPELLVAPCRPRAWSGCRSCALVWVRPSAATPTGAGGGGRGGVRRAASAASPPGAAVPSGGGGTSPRPHGELEGRRPCGPQAGGGSGGGRGGGAAPRFPTLLPWGGGP